MKKLLFQSDDYGISRGVTAGILDGIANGIIKNTGLFVNMQHSDEAAAKIRDIDVCLGIDINLVAGKPVSDPALVPHLLDESGNFRSSKQILQQNRLMYSEGFISRFEDDPYPYEEVLIETENQLKKFVQLVGRLPEYFHAHSLCTPNTDQAARKVAEKYGIYRSFQMINDLNCDHLPCSVGAIKGASLEDQLAMDIEQDLLSVSLPSLKENRVGYYVCHCGYVDDELFDHTSLTVRRLKDLAGAMSPLVKEYIEANGIQLITYRDLQ